MLNKDLRRMTVGTIIKMIERKDISLNDVKNHPDFERIEKLINMKNTKNNDIEVANNEEVNIMRHDLLNDSTVKANEFFNIEMNKKLKEYVDDTIQENGFSGDYNDLLNQPINSLPVHSYSSNNRIIFIEVMNLEKHKWYKLDPKDARESNSSLSLAHFFEDGTRKNFSALTGGYAYSLFFVLAKGTNNITLRQIDIAGGFYERVITIGADSASSTSTIVPLSLSTLNEKEFIPTKDYHPATKKYVDDTIQENRPCYDERVLETFNSAEDFNGDITGKVVIEEVSSASTEEITAKGSFIPKYVKMGDVAPVFNNLASNIENGNVKATCTVRYEHADLTEVDTSELHMLDENCVALMDSTWSNRVFFVYNEITSPTGAVLPPGIWYVYLDNGKGTVIYPISYSIEILDGDFKKLSYKYIDYMPGKNVTGEAFIVYDNINDFHMEENGIYSIAQTGAEIFNDKTNVATGEYSHAEGAGTAAYGDYSHAEGLGSVTFEAYSHAEGYHTVSNGPGTHAEGRGTISEGMWSHAENYGAYAKGWGSHAEGNSTIASGEAQHVQGRFNIEDTENKYAHIVGNGEYAKKRSNAHTLDWSGNAWFKGNVFVNGTSQVDAQKLATEEFVNNQIASLVDSAPDAMNTLNELANSINNHATEYEAYVATVSNALAGKAPASHTSDTTLHITAAERTAWNAKSNLALGTTSSTAFRGDYGNTAYNHSQSAHAPSNAQKNSDITKAEIEAKLTGAITSHTHSYLPLSGGTLSGDLKLYSDNYIKFFGRADNSTGSITHGDNGLTFESVGNYENPGMLFILNRTENGNTHGGGSNRAASQASVSMSHNGSGGSIVAATLFSGELAGNAATADKVNTNLVVKLNGGTTEGTNLFTFNGSAAKTINITPSAIGAAASSHGTHLTLGTGSGNAYRGDYGNTAYTHSQAAHAPSNAQKNSDITKAEIEAKLTGTITSHNHSGTYAPASHNHTSLTGITSLAFATEGSDSGSIGTTVDGTNTYFDFNLADDATQNDMWRWRFTPSGGTIFNVMTLDATSLTDAKLTVTGNVTATSFTENGTALSSKYAAASHGTHLTLGTGSGNAFRGDYGNTAYNHSQAAHAPSNAQKNSDITKAEIEAKLTGAITSHNHNAITSRGNVTCETGANARPAVAGLSMAQAYSNGYPTQYGNIISLRGAGDGQILVGWSGTSGGHAPMYVRSRRDTTDADWSGWAQVYTSANPQTSINGYTLWVGTQAQYDAISSKSSTTIYYIKS